MAFFRPKTVEGAIKGLLTAVADLEHVADVSNQRCSANRVLVTDLEQRISRDEDEAAKAQNIAKKLREITEPEEA